MRTRLWTGSLLFIALLAGTVLWLEIGRAGGGRKEATSGESVTTVRPHANHVFLIVVDTLRADRLSCYGYQEHATSNIDRLASMGVKFARAQSVASWTRPSMGAMLTSLYPTQLGLLETPVPTDRTFAWRESHQQRSHLLHEHEQTLAELLSAIGFATGGFVDQPALNHARSYQQGFDDWYYPISPDEVRRYDPELGFAPQRWPSLKYADRSDWALIQKFGEWLAERKGQERLFVWLHLLTPHVPYQPAQKYAPPVAEDQASPPSNSQRYDGEVRAIDDMTGTILDMIERHVGFEQSLIVFASDHGEEFGDHGMHGHGHSLHREVVHVPLIMASPGLPGGRTVEAYVRTIDILPTVLDLVGQESLPPDLEGTSLVPLMLGRGKRLAAYSEAMLYGSTERSLIVDGYKLMYDQQGEQYKLYHVDSDVSESVDLGAREPQKVLAMRQRLREFHARLKSDFRLRRARHAEKPSAEERKRALEALRALGYVDD